MGRPKGSTNKRTQTAQQDMQQQAMTEIAKQAPYRPDPDGNGQHNFELSDQARAKELSQPLEAQIEKATSAPAMMTPKQRAEILSLCHELKTTTTFKQNGLSEDQITFGMADVELKMLHKQAQALRDKQAKVPAPLPQSNLSIRLAELRAIRDVTDLEMHDEEEDRFNETIWKTVTIAGLPVRFNSFCGNYETTTAKTYSRFSFYYLDDESDMEEHFFHLFNQNLASKIVSAFDANEDEPFATTLKKIPLANGHTMWQMQRATF